VSDGYGRWRRPFAHVARSTGAHFALLVAIAQTESLLRSDY